MKRARSVYHGNYRDDCFVHGPRGSLIKARESGQGRCRLSQHSGRRIPLTVTRYAAKPRIVYGYSNRILSK